ncbi:MAG TPA: hypothetical protein PKA64_24740, partial [Myxococcota bacterium]|nr:hypothetical protein [Myxococcota bacterium]
SEVHGSNRGLRAGGGLDVRVLPSVRLFGVGYRRSGPGRADAVTAAPLEHRVRLPRACLAGLTDAGLGRSVLLLRGFHAAGIAFKQAGASSSDHPLGRWIRQGTHLRRLCMGGRVGAVQPDHVELELTAGLIGGHADDADPAQLWTGFDGYAMSLQLVLVSSEQEPVEDAVRVALSSRARSGVRVFQQPMTTAEVGGLTSVDVCVRALQAGRVEGDEGRLVHDLAVRWEAPDRVWAEFSNAGLGAGAFEGEVFVRRARLRAAQDREVLT